MKLLFTYLLVISGAIAQPVAGVYAPPKNSAVLRTTFVDWDSLPVRTSANGQGRAVFDNPTPTLEKFEMHITTLLPGKMSHPVHQHPWEELLLIKEGEVDVSINGEIHRAGPGCLIFFASHDPHNLKNVGDHPATSYVINFCTDLVHTVADLPAHEQAVPGKLGSSVIDGSHQKTAATKTGSRVGLVDSPTLTFARLESHITTLNVGQSTAANLVDAGDELFVLKTGMLEATVNGITSRLAAGSFFYCAPNDRRAFRNIGGVPAAYQVIKVVSARTPAAKS
jgi:quercetin dioxygenase-like cupin family protein